MVALRLRHPNIVTVMGTSVDPPTRNLLLVTALLERGTLYDLLHNDTVSLSIISFKRSVSSIDQATCPLTHAPDIVLMCSFAHSPTHSPTNLLTHLLARSLNHSLKTCNKSNYTSNHPCIPYLFIQIYDRHIQTCLFAFPSNFVAGMSESLHSRHVLVHCRTQLASTAVHRLLAGCLREPSLFAPTSQCMPAAEHCLLLTMHSLLRTPCS